MCRVYNSIGSLTMVKSHLYKNGVREFNSLKEVITFQKNYSISRLQIIQEHEQLMENEKQNLNKAIFELADLIETTKDKKEKQIQQKIDKNKLKIHSLSLSSDASTIQKLKNSLIKWYFKRNVQLIELNANKSVKRSVRKFVKDQNKKNNRYQYLLSHFSEAVETSCQDEMSNLERKKRTIDEINSFIYGALGEQRVVKELKQLSDDYFLINDFSLSFTKPIYNLQENEYIKSIQIDHILVGPPGIFLIETKNWSEKSLSNDSLLSPVRQIKRASLILFKLLSESITRYKINLQQHNWGVKKVPLRNLIVLIKSRPIAEFQYVKILTVNELLGYVKYFNPVFSIREVEEIANFINRMNETQS